MERTLREKEAQFATLVEYRHTRLAAEEEYNIAPQLVDFVTGNSEAEIDASIDRVKAKTAEIMAQVAEAQGQRQRQRPCRPRAALPWTCRACRRPVAVKSPHRKSGTWGWTNMRSSGHYCSMPLRERARSQGAIFAVTCSLQAFG